MSEAGQSKKPDPSNEPTVEDVRAITGAATPHFSQQVRERVLRLIDNLPEGHPARKEAEREISRLEQLTREGERQGPIQEGEQVMPSLGSGVPIPRRKS